MELCVSKKLAAILVLTFFMIVSLSILIPSYTRSGDISTFQAYVKRKLATLLPKDSPVWIDLDKSVNISAVDKYVTFADVVNDGRGLGNLMFDLVSVIYVAMLSGRQAVLRPPPFASALDEVD